MSTGGFADEPGDLFPDLLPAPAVPPDHADVIRNALRLAADTAYPDDNARPYQEALRALAEREIAVVRADVLRALLGGEEVSVDQWRILAEAVKEGR